MLCLRATYLEDQCEWKLEKRKMISPAQRQKEHLVKKYAECRKCLKLIYKAEEEQPLPQDRQTVLVNSARNISIRSESKSKKLSIVCARCTAHLALVVSKQNQQVIQLDEQATNRAHIYYHKIVTLKSEETCLSPSQFNPFIKTNKGCNIQLISREILRLIVYHQHTLTTALRTAQDTATIVYHLRNFVRFYDIYQNRQRQHPRQLKKPTCEQYSTDVQPRLSLTQEKRQRKFGHSLSIKNVEAVPNKCIGGRGQ